MERWLTKDWSKAIIIASISILTYSNFTHASSSPNIIEDNQSASINYQQFASKTFVYNPRSLKWTATHNGKVVRAGRASGGRHYCPDVKRACRTPSGSYSVLSKGGPGCKSSRYPVGKGGAPMPHCMFFSKNYAIHGSPDVPNHNASHGCIRVKPSEARWLNRNFLDIGSKVVVKSY